MINQTVVPIATCVLLLVSAIDVTADDAAGFGKVRIVAEGLATATLQNDFEKVADLTYPKLVEVMGGRATMIATAKAAMDQVRKDGFAFESYAVANPSKFFATRDHKFAVLPTSVVLTTPSGKIRARSYLLGISLDDGKSWSFLDGSGLDDKGAREKVLPKLPKGLTLPEKQAPEIVGDE